MSELGTGSNLTLEPTEAFPSAALTMRTPVSLLASITEMRQVLGRTADMMSSTSTRAVTFDTGTNVTSETKQQSHTVSTEDTPAELSK